MKKILILSYHFEPLNAIASQRALGYANHFKKFGFEPTIVTHQRTKLNDVVFCEKSELFDKLILEEKEHYKVYRLSVGKFRRGQFLKWIEKSKLNKFGIILSWILGHLDTRGGLLNHKLTERGFLKEHLKTNQYDVIMGIFSPHYHLSNCNWAHKKFNIPFVLDYRDLWDNRIINKNYKADFTEKIQDFFCGFWWKKWSRKSLFQTITSNPWKEKLKLTTKHETLVITNGFDTSFIENITKNNKDYFSIVHNGTIYRHQNLSIFLNGYKLFLKRNPNAKIICEFIGSIRNNYSNKPNGFLNPDELNHNIDFKNLLFTERIPYNEALSMTINADILLAPSFGNFPGTYGGKIFEYLMTGNNILISPDDHSVNSEILLKTKAGIVINTEDQIAEYIEKMYNEWLINGKCLYSGLQHEITLYSRENQTRLYSEYLHNKLKK
jgi:hypothetical protein